MGIHLFHYAHGGKRIASHDVVQDAFMSIVRNMAFHVLREQTHIFPPTSLQSSCQRVDIVLSIDGIGTLVNVVIVDPTQVDMVSWATLPMGWLQH